MSVRTWGIKLGSCGAYAKWCRERQSPIVGIGWRDVDVASAASGNWEHFREVVAKYLCDSNQRKIGSAAGNIFRFIQLAQPGDFVWHYDPTDHNAYLAKIVSEPRRRELLPGDNDVDIWHYREVEFALGIPIDELHGDIVASLRFPKLTFWSMDWITPRTEEIWNHRTDAVRNQAAESLAKAYESLIGMVREHLRALNYKDWEQLTAEYVRAHGGLTRGPVGGSRKGIDIEAAFQRGLLPPSTIYFQVKREINHEIDWPQIESYMEIYGERADVGYVSAFGFSEKARHRAEEEGVVLLDDSDMAKFVLTHPLSDEQMRRKLGLPASLPGRMRIA